MRLHWILQELLAPSGSDSLFLGRGVECVCLLGGGCRADERGVVYILLNVLDCFEIVFLASTVRANRVSHTLPSDPDAFLCSLLENSELVIMCSCNVAIALPPNSRRHFLCLRLIYIAWVPNVIPPASPNVSSPIHFFPCHTAFFPVDVF